MGNALLSTKNCISDIFGWENDDGIDWKSSENHDLLQESIKLEDFIIERELGRGGFGRVLLVRKKIGTKNISYALKLQSKEKISKQKMTNYIKLERSVLMLAQHPFIVTLKAFFETPKLYCLLMEYLPGGHLFSLLNECRKFPTDVATFYIAEVVIALIHLHGKMNIIYRDLKPENILLNSNGHIKLTDFGLCQKADQEAYTFAGTIEYMAPEILLRKGYGKSVDWWTVGILLYQMLSGSSPFKSTNRSRMESLIIENKPTFPPYFSPEAVDLLKKLLVSDPIERLGNKNEEEIKQHPFFKKVQWDHLLALEIKPPTLESIKNETYFL